MSKHKITALVTGASAGLGAEFCRQLASRCDVIIAIARRGERVCHHESHGLTRIAHPVPGQASQGQRLDTLAVDHFRRPTDQCLPEITMVISIPLGTFAGPLTGFRLAGYGADAASPVNVDKVYIEIYSSASM